MFTGQAPPKIVQVVPKKLQSQLEKAKLRAYKNEATDIEFMFNPTEISFKRSVKWESKQGNRGSTILPKVNFSGVEPYRFTLKQLLFDTYETRTSVMTYIEFIKEGVEAINRTQDKRPPVYIFTWGASTKYFHCVMTSLTYTLTMFLTNGTPVRAMVDIELQQVEENNLPGGKEPAPKGSKRGQNIPKS